MGLSALDRYRFDVNGYAVIDGALRPPEVRRLRRALDARNLPAPGPTVDEQRFGFGGEFLGWDQAFPDLVDHLAVLAELIGPFARLDHAYGITMAPGTAGLGCIPGSHRADEPVPHRADALVMEVSQPVGSLLVFTEALAHCTIPWEELRTA